MAVLIDTNVLLRSVQSSHPMRPAAVRSLERLFLEEETLHITIQNVAEFWNAATRPAGQNGLGITIEKAIEELEHLQKFFDVLSESTASYGEWKAIVSSKRVVGAQVHDARLAAVMRTNGITRIVTFNLGDFARFDHIEAIHPNEIY
jgi:predicted nucleic acid-binding protein